ncbi:GAF and ANTAR domain-containing protein [Mycolicibacterium neworleansense]|uniref:ANTAR domain-containing protein n=1 Tax=Mycolicibacterium neworleansense TaxID=146018 RepID=A0A0H5RWU0_9MYCO|nr:GAF and ANTAR domain-containing protein [Mycolicibacterium neworleansense]CRZ18590.1 ANTAR domain-containing protein [Mycolicibacterium neworleansense]
MSLGREQMIASQVNELIRVIQDHSPADVDTVLAYLVESAVEYVPGAEYAGVTIAGRRGDVRTAAATHAYPKILDEIQQRWAQGPCLSTTWEHHVIKIDDIQDEVRWPDYCREVATTTPIRSVLSYQLFADHQTMGALNFCAQTAEVFDSAAVEAGMVVATHIALAWNLARHDRQFRSALATRDVIGQAKGMFMERYKIDAVQAFELLNDCRRTRIHRSSTSRAISSSRITASAPATTDGSAGMMTGCPPG